MKTKFMNEAIKQAKKAFDKGEIPIGAVVVKDDKIIARAYNNRQNSRICTNHAEILALQKACKRLGDWRLCDCDIYVTTIPCPMCAGAIVNARIRKVFYGAQNSNKYIFEQIMTQSELNHICKFEGDVMADECSRLLSDFFKQKRHKS